MKDIKRTSFLLRNQHAQRKFWYFVHRKNGELVKNGHFHFSESIFETKNQVNILQKKISSMNLGEQLLLTTFST